MTCVHRVKWSVKRPEDCRFRLSVSHYKDRIVAPDEYSGATVITPSDETQILPTKDKTVRSDIVVTPTPESNVFLVTVTVTSETTGTADKTFAEVLEAWDAGKVVRGYAPAIGLEVDFTIHSSTTEDGESFAALVPSGTGLMSITLYDGGDSNPANVAIMTYGG